ncbi:dihydrodipicolinate synthase family protein [Enterococcus sp. 5B3_DIV0040]|uniref:dihydrodipicolinate synthase family protein n=1 Tax=Enterococcus sp. 5B3_DIV0040 TaxID=1834182 RepID=UPI000A3590F8|nr:dihydrodipicolinate synthase family protein [Enterococcus sp. 5B3_DIV0040]OTO01295.1 N-acetylneuraminate lyase [Enterococcus sp. 5B3_DIV0040]
MTKLDKYKGIIPAFYACYDEAGNISGERVEKLANYYLDKGVKGLYVGGSSGECIYQTVEERKLVLEHVMRAVGGKMTIIAHIAAPSTRDSVALAKHAESLGVDALAAIPPIYFVLPEEAIRAYWLAMVEATKLDFIIYNIPQTTGYSLSPKLFSEMMTHPQVIGVKNSSMPVQDIYLFKNSSKKDAIVFNGPDEQFIAGRIMGADSGIGGTYGVMPELFIAANQAFMDNDIQKAQKIQNSIDQIIFKMVQAEGNLYAIIKRILAKHGMEIGKVRAPLPQATEKDGIIIDEADQLIQAAIDKYLIR